eukprot:3911877-Alexandrium_andersonii.AAC.1
MSSEWDGVGGAMGFLRSGKVVPCESVEHRHHYVFPAASRMGWLPENVVAGSSAFGCASRALVGVTGLLACPPLILAAGAMAAAHLRSGWAARAPRRST